MTTLGPTDHLGDLLSAMVDGELSLDEAGAVRRHLTTCPQCVAELEEIRRIRAVVRGLPPVDPPFGFFERLVRQRPAARRGIAAVAGGIAAAITALMILTPGQQEVSPPVADLVETHAATSSVAGDPVSQLVPAATPVRFDP